MTIAYTVEVEKGPCDHCGSGGFWVIVDPKGIAGGTSYGDRENAEEIADLMNEAYRLGYQTAKAQSALSELDRHYAKAEAPQTEPADPAGHAGGKARNESKEAGK